MFRELASVIILTVQFTFPIYQSIGFQKDIEVDRWLMDLKYDLSPNHQKFVVSTLMSTKVIWITKFGIIKLVTVRTVFTPGVYHKDLLIIYKIIAVLLGSELFPQQF